MSRLFLFPMAVFYGCFPWLCLMRSAFRILCRLWLFPMAGSYGKVCVSDFVPAMAVSYDWFLWLGLHFCFGAGYICFLGLVPMPRSAFRILCRVWLFPMAVSYGCFQLLCLMRSAFRIFPQTCVAIGVLTISIKNYIGSYLVNPRASTPRTSKPRVLQAWLSAVFL